MKRVYRLAIALFLGISLSGCLVPEKFKASATFRADASYTYKFDGTAVYALAAAAIKEKGALTDKEEADLKRSAEKARTEKGVKQSKYLGSGRYEMSLEREMTPGQHAELLDLILVRKDKEGVVTVSYPELKEKDRKSLSQLGIKPEGAISVYLPAGAKVISHNAVDTPGIFDKAYRWKISSFEEQPTIKFTLSQ